MAQRRTASGRRKIDFGSAAAWQTAYLYDRGRDTWRAEFLRHDEEGQPHKSTKIIHAAKVSDALEAVRERQRELEEEYAKSVAEAARKGAGSAIEDCLQRELDSRISAKPSTLSEYRTRIRYYIAPYFEGADVADITEADVNAWVTQLKEKGYADDTVRKALVFLRSTLARAQREGLCPVNVAAQVKYKPYRPKRRSNALDERSLKTLLAVLRAELDGREDPEPFYLACLMSLLTGMRREELCGLRWRCVDVDAGRIEVSEVLCSVRDTGELYTDTPKSDTSERTVLFADELLDGALRARRAAMAHTCLEGGVEFSGSLFVLGEADGSFMHLNYLTTRWKKLSEGLGLTGCMGARPTFHDLRHTYATVALAAGASVKAVSESMGHADAKITLERYTSVLDSTREQTAATVSSALAGYSA